MITGVQQGCILSSILFAMANDLVLKRTMIDQGINWYGRSKLSDLDFAVDITTFLDITHGL